MRIAKSYIGVKETGNNRGKTIDSMIVSLGGSKGSSWCGYFAGTVLNKAGAKEPKYRGGMAQGYITKKSIRASRVAKGYYKVNPGDLIIWGKYKYNRNTGKGHIEINTNQIRADSLEAVGGNTSGYSGGSTDNGDGVYPTKRTIKFYGNFKIIYITPIS